MNGRRRATRIAIGAVVVALALVVGAARADYRESFKAAMTAIDRSNWTEAVGHLEEAIRENPKESSERILLTGAFSRTYLPYFYLGLAHFESGGNCEAAIDAWGESLDQGVVRDFRRQIEELEQKRQQCLARVLPSQLAGTQRLLDELRGALGDVAALDRHDAEVEGVARLRSLLQQAEGLVAGVETAERPIADLRRAQAMARSGSSEAQDVMERLEASASVSERELEAPTVTVSETVSDAVAEPLDQPSEATPADGTQTNPPAVDSSLASPARGDVVAGSGDAPSASDAPILTPAESDPRSSTARGGERVQELIDAGERLLGAAGIDAIPSALLTTQRARLSSLVLALRDGANDESELERTRASLAALRLLLAARFHFRGESEQALETLTLGPAHSSPLEAQTAVIEAAARFDLFRVSGDFAHRAAARAALERALSSNEALALDAALSPAFLTFAEDVRSARGTP